MSRITDLQGRLDERRDRLARAFQQAGEDLDFSKVTEFDGDTTAKVEEVRKLNAEIDDNAKELEGLRGLEAIRDRNHDERTEIDKTGRAFSANGSRSLIVGDDHVERKTLGEMFTDTAAYTGWKPGMTSGPLGEFSLPGRAGDMRATLFQTSAGWAPESLRTGRVVEKAVRPIQVIDLIPAGRTSSAAVVYMEETTFTNNAAETSEGGTYAESALALTQRTNTVRKIATFLPVTDEQLEDVDGIQSYVDNRLSFMLEQRLDSQLLVGDGIAPNLTGLLNVAGIQTQAKGADPVPDAIYKAMVLVRVTGRATPSGLIMNPTDWMDVKLLRTADGMYIWGNPADASPDRIWGIPVALSDALTLNTAIVGDFRTHTELVMRRDVQVQISNSHSTYFIEGKQAIRADLRCAFVVYRPAAICTVTGV